MVKTEVSVLLPDRKYKGLWHRILHDRTAESIQEEVSRLPHANVTTIPFHFESIDDAKVPLSALVIAGTSTDGAGLGHDSPSQHRPLSGAMAAARPSQAARRSPTSATATACGCQDGCDPLVLRLSTTRRHTSSCWQTTRPESRSCSSAGEAWPASTSARR